MPEIVILAGAERDILETYVRLEHGSDERGEKFTARIDESLEQIGSFPESAPRFRENVRRVLVRGFPHGLFYTIEGDRVMVQAVLDLRQHPAHILRRLGLG